MTMKHTINRLKSVRLTIFTLFLMPFIFGCGDAVDGNSKDEKKDVNPDPIPIEFEVSTLTTEVSPGGDGVSVADNGNIYISGGLEGKNITRVMPGGDVSIFATGFESANGSDFDSNGNLYVADYRGNAIRKITADGTFSTFADDLDGPAGIYVDHEDNVIVSLFGAGFSGEGATVLKITADGTVSELAAGNGLSDVIGVAGDGNGRIFAANWNSGQLFEVSGGEAVSFADIGSAVNQIEYGDGYIYIPAPQMHKILRVDLNGNIEVIAGTGEAGSSDGPGTSATFDRPNSCALSPDGEILYVYDANTGHLRKIDLMD